MHDVINDVFFVYRVKLYEQELEEHPLNVLTQTQTVIRKKLHYTVIFLEI